MVSRNVRDRLEQAGFTLVEMIVVIAVMAAVAGLILVRQPWHSVGVNTDATAQALANGLRLARSRAIAQDRDVTVATAVHGFSVDGGAAWVLPPEQALTPSKVTFTPDGGSTGGTILLVAGQRRISLDVNWLTGRVRRRDLNTR